jgi:hypothetical protein
MNADKIFIIGSCVACCLSVASGAELVTDEATRLKVLAAVFPGMSITATPGKRIDDSRRWPAGRVELDFPDALKREVVYRITGAPTTENETCAADDIIKQNQSAVREVRAKIYDLSPSRFVAVAQYKFVDANPAMACPSIARITLVEDKAGVFTASSKFEPDTLHHWGLQRIQMASFTGDTAEQLFVESDFGGAGVLGSELLIFDVSAAGLGPIVETDVSVYDGLEKENLFVKSLDIARTRAIKGTRFCFTMTTYIEDDKKFNPPKITHPCYKRGEGVEKQ